MFDITSGCINQYIFFSEKWRNLNTQSGCVNADVRLVDKVIDKKSSGSNSACSS